MKVLVVDDEQSNLDEVKTIFGNCEIDVAGCFYNNPISAMEAALNEEWDAVFLDIQMPEINGLEIAQRIMNQNSDIDIVFVTAFNHYAAEAFEVNAIDYLLKPIRQERLDKALKKILDKKNKTANTSKRNDLVIKALGNASIHFGENEMRWNRNKTKELFYYLLINREKKVHKSTICEVLWQDYEMKKAISNLQVTMCRLRKDISFLDKRQICIEYQDNCYCLKLNPERYDVDEFLKYASQSDIQSLEKAEELYGGALFDSLDFLWIECEREHLRLKYVQVVLKLSEHYLKEENYKKAESMLSYCIEKNIPDDSVIELFLKAVRLSSGSAALKRAYERIKNLYIKSLDMDVPGNIKKQYKRLLKDCI